MSAAVPMTWSVSQGFAVAAQRFTSPCVTGVAPEVTVAVAVIIVPAATDDAELPFAVSARLVEVAVEPGAGRTLRATVVLTV